MIQAYYGSEGALGTFIDHAPTLEDVESLLKQRVYSADTRQTLCDSLVSQYQTLPDNARSNAEIEKLRNANSYTVCTGHQLTLFGGPVFVLLKALGTIQLARRLNERNPEHHVVPVFWLASEDHDIDEIRPFRFYRTEKQWQTNEVGPSGRLSTTELGEWLGELEDGIRNEDLKSLARQARDLTEKGGNLAKLTQLWLHQFFKDTELLILDPDRPELKANFAKVMQQDVSDSAFHDALQQTNEQLNDAGFTTQVSPRRTHLFYLDGEDRLRIDEQSDGFITADQKYQWTSDELLKAIADTPQKFSPNVILRPVYQEVILPNLAYIGGPGELQYWLQLQSVFKAADVSFPVPLLRPRMMHVGGRIAEKLEQFGLSVKEVVSTDLLTLQNDLAQQQQAPPELSSWHSSISELIGQYKDSVLDFDGSLEGVLKGMEVRWQKDVEGLEKKIAKLARQKSDQQLQQLSRLYEELRPGGKPQERHLFWITMIDQYGMGLISDLLACIDLFDQRQLWLYPVENS